ncbi:UNVERIFIED_CONTAM: hypothetical protein Sradi_0357800 [Sesamum radiatum]|uniref:Uncharacterized protein n=1 Tax=Sesamum radiatum TaxID=300843 RepID=A0AAW2W5G4_SESRA
MTAFSRTRSLFIRTYLLSLRSLSAESCIIRHRAFDIDGVILRGDTPIGGSPQALKRLYDDSGALRIPYVFLTNGGGVPESKRATELSKLLGVPIFASQVIQGHSPFRQLVNRFENELIIAVGKGEPATVMSEYGFKNVLSIDEYASYFKHIDPLGQYKNWTNKLAGYERSSSREEERKTDPCLQRVEAVFIVSDSVDWSRDIQVVDTVEEAVDYILSREACQPHHSTHGK